MKTLWFTLSILLVAVSSCDKNLLDQDINPNALTPDTFWQDEQDAIKGIIGAYSPFTDIWYYSRGEIFVSDYRDDVVNPNGTSARTNPGRFAGTSEQNFVNRIWRVAWFGISRSNEVIFNVPTIEDPEFSDELRNNIMGEAYFLRAYNYFVLLNNWLNVPLITVPVEQLEDITGVEQADPNVVRDQIIADLMQAKSLLPTSWDAVNLGRATSGAATAMLGKVYLYNQQWDLASAAFQEVMSSGTYSLAADYGDNFSTLTENNSESIFEIQFLNDDMQAWGGDQAGISRDNNFTPDIAPAPEFSGQDGMTINQWALDLFLDERTINNEIDPRAFSTLFFNTAETTTYEGEVLASTIYEGQTYQEVYPAGNTTVYGKKYLAADEGGVTTANFHNSGNNLRIIRYADVLLMFAEAEIMDNNGTANQAAVDAINEVRARVDMPPFDLSMTMEDIRDERVKELTLERSRYFDLLRWGMVKERIVDVPGIKSGSGGVGAYQPGREYLDIPQNELNLNQNFSHNPGYQ
ncbi:MAG: RagB/SusD family nutrient uptake outer membrane protein [Bacteroidota bacterium]